MRREEELYEDDSPETEELDGPVFEGHRLAYIKAIDLDEATESAINNEPVITENSLPRRDNFKYGRKSRWTHMSEQAEAALSAKMDSDAVEPKISERELKRKSREAR